jgi:hypothetical protein
VDVRVIDKASTYNALADLMTSRGDHLDALPLYCKAHNLLKTKILKIGDDQHESDDEEDLITFEEFTRGCKNANAGGHILDGQLVDEKVESESDVLFPESEDDVAENNNSESHFFDINFSNESSFTRKREKSSRDTSPVRDKPTLFWPMSQAWRLSVGESASSSEDDVDSVDESVMASESEEYRKYVDGVGEPMDSFDEEDDDEDDGFLRVNLVNKKLKDEKSSKLSDGSMLKTSSTFEGGYEDGISRTHSSML